MSNPIVSVVIPTHGRPEYLVRAVISALESVADQSIEVLVVPNGPDTSWLTAMERFSHDERVRVLPIEKSHGNAARNHGLANAQGKYIRFLDDDDFLFSQGARQQIDLMENQCGEICSGRVQHIGSDGAHLGRVGVADTQDFVVAALSISGFRLPTSNVFLRSSLDKAVWDEHVPRAQDYVWMLSLAGMREWRWLDVDEDVGGWCHHTGSRTSSTSATQTLPIWVFDALLSLHRKLEKDERLNDNRRHALALAIWELIHTYFPRFPLLCHAYAKQALQIDATARPALNQLLGRGLGNSISPLLMEWLLLPKRYGNHVYRSAHERLFGKEAFRKL